MIKNIIFDMGGVLIEFSPALFLKRMGFTKEESELVIKEVSNSKNWKLGDLGLVDMHEEAVLDEMVTNIPDYLKSKTKDYINHWFDYSNPIEGMEELIISLKKNGYKIYLLSNAGYDQRQYFKKYNYEQYLDGKLISCDIKEVKPNKGIYEAILKKYNLIGEECVFTDDMLINALGAKEAGINPIHFKDIDSFKEELKKLGVKID